VFFGKLFFAVAPFLNNSPTLADPTISGIMLTVRYVHNPRLAMANLYLLKNGLSQNPREIFVAQ